MELNRPTLVHSGMGMKIEDFFIEIDKTGGWPLGFTQVSFYHSVKNEGRVCRFTNYILHTEWWSNICSSDDYYWWKISEGKKKKILEEARMQLIKQLKNI